MKTLGSVQPLWARVFALAVMIQFPLWCHADPLGTWNLVLSNTPAPLTGMAYGNGTFVGVGNGLDYVSHDGSNWAVYANPTFLNQMGIAYGNGLFVSYGTIGQTRPDYVSTSIDGIHWTTIYTNNTLINAAAYGNNTWVFAGPTTNGSEILTASAASSNWSWTQVPLPETPTNLSFLNGSFVMMLNYNSVEAIFSSPDGSTWQFMSKSPITNGCEIIFGNGNYMLSQFNRTAWTSPDLINWSTNPFYPTSSGSLSGQIGYFGNEIVEVDENWFDYVTNSYAVFITQCFLISSLDGISWHTNGALFAPIAQTNSISSTSINFLLFGQGTLLVGASNNVYQSGMFATSPTPPPNALSISTYAGVTINGTVGSVYQVQFSTDLNSWQTITNLILPYSPYLWFDTTSTVNGKRFYRSVQMQ